MSYSDNISRLSRLTAILLRFLSKSWITIDELSEQFAVSKRTIYRDLSALEQAGVPIIPITGKGYGIMEGYKLPPVMFTEAEANALIFGKKLIAKTKDESVIREFTSAIDKIKSILTRREKEKAEFLSARTIIGKNWENERTSNYLSQIQQALTNYHVLRIDYLKEEATQISQRTVEPFAIYHNTSENWVLIAWCRLRESFRSFRIDRIQEMGNTSKTFTPHKITLEEYVEIQRKKHFNISVT